MGHTTRCLPLIHYLIQEGLEVVVAGNETQIALIKNTFPQVRTLFLKGYEVQYPAHRFLGLKIMAQIPRLLKIIKTENKWLKKLQQQERFDAVISDNRYGLHHPETPSYFITHQLQIQTGLGNWLDEVLFRLHIKYLRPFKAIGIVDVAGEINLAGKLSHPLKQLPAVHYMGLLSAFSIVEEVKAAIPPVAILVLLSGVEPQRSILSNMLWEQLLQTDKKVIFIEGNAQAAVRNAPPHIQHFLQLSASALLPLINVAEVVICRSGYSSLMDLIYLNKKAIIIPTPGQTEQLYLAHYLSSKHIFQKANQQDFNLKNELDKIANTPARQAFSENDFKQYRLFLKSILSLGK